MAFKMIPLTFLVIFLLAKNVDATIGMNWGRQNAQRLIPSMVVDLLLQNEIKEARIYSSEEDLLMPFSGSGIGLSITISNVSMIDNLEKSRSSVQSRMMYFKTCNIRRIYIGRYLFVEGLMNGKYIILNAIQALQSLQTAINEAGYGDQIKTTFTQHPSILKMTNAIRPSACEFLDEIKEEMATAIRILQQNNAPFVVDMFPIVFVDTLKMDPNFAFPDNKSTQVVKDINSAVYTNAFEFAYDSCVWALNKLNASDMKVIVGGIGWPTDGFPGANASNAERFYKGLLPLVASNKGTPMRPRAPIDIFVHSLTDENQMPYVGFFARHFGIYRSNGKPKYKIDLSGRGRDVYPTDAKGIMRMPGRWCLFTGDRTDIANVQRQFAYACSKADCSTMAKGGSCSHLSFDQNISYAFNMHFQFQFQDEKACDFGGLGYVSVQDPSTEECVFPVEVVKGQQHNFNNASSAVKGFQKMSNCGVFVFLLSILGGLFWN